MHEEDRVPGRQEPDRRFSVRIGQQPILDVEELGPVFGPELPKLQVETTAFTGETFIPRNAATSATDAGPKAAR